jgi:hypothetical protein
MTALPSMPFWYKRSGGILPPNTANESDMAVVNGMLVLAVFNRPPLTQQVIFFNISDPANPIQLAAKPWAGAMGSILVDASGVVHIYGSAPPPQSQITYNNAIIHSTVDPNNGWEISAPTTIIQLPVNSGLGFANIMAGAVPGGYLLGNGQDYSNGGFAQSFIFSTTPDFASYTQKAAFFEGGSFTNETDFIGRGKITMMPDGWTYITSDSVNGYCRIARTQDFINFNFSTTTAYGFMGPGPTDAFPGKVGGTPFYDGNVVYTQWQYAGQPVVYAAYFESNETNNGQLMLAVYLGTLADLFAQFSF